MHSIGRNVLLNQRVQYKHTGCIFSGILMQMEASPDEEDEITLEIKSDIQLILSALCESDMHRKVKLTLVELQKLPCDR